MELWFKLTDTTNIGDLDHFFTNSYAEKKLVKFVFDARECNVTFKKVMGLKPLLEKHRQSTKLYLKNSKIIMKSKILCMVVNSALKLIKPEKPVVFIYEK